MNRAATPTPLTPHSIELRIKSCDEIFDDSVPSCVMGKTVHSAVVEQLLEKVAEAPRKAPIRLSLILPAGEAATAKDIAADVRAHFEACRVAEQRHINRIFRVGRIALLLGLVTVLLANALGEGIRVTFSGQFAHAVANGLEIFGWVAMWRPAELLLYDWIPVRRRRNSMARLATMDIEWRSAE